MIDFLFRIYITSPFHMKKVIARLFVLLRPLLSPFVRRKRLGGYYLYLDPSDNASYGLYAAASRQDRHLVEVFLRFLSANPGACFVDVGASYGLYTLAIAHLGRFGLLKKVFAFEPDRRSFLALSHSLEDAGLSDLVDLKRALVGEEDGTGMLFLNRTSSISNRSFASTSDTLSFAAVEELESVALSGYLASRVPVEHQRFLIKVDVEGNDLKVLRGVLDTLQRSSGYLLQFEYYPLAIREVGLSPEDYIEFVRELPFDVTLVSAPGVEFKCSNEKEALLRLMTEFADGSGPARAANILVARSMNVPDALGCIGYD